jgi:hypothetical protein
MIGRRSFHPAIIGFMDSLIHFLQVDPRLADILEFWRTLRLGWWCVMAIENRIEFTIFVPIWVEIIFKLVVVHNNS